MEDKIIEEFSQLQQLYDVAATFLLTYSFQVIGAIIILIIGIYISKKIGVIVFDKLEKRILDITLRTYVSHTVRILILFCFVVIALGKFGISIAPFVAALGALTLGAGFALQGLVSNYGAGLSIITTRPFKVGDTITVIGVSGVVKEIKLAATIVETEDQEEITIPNKHIIGEILLNTFDYKLVEATIGIDYKNNPDTAISAIHSAITDLHFVSSNPAPQIGIDNFGDSGINIGIRVWVPTQSYSESRYLINLMVLRAVKKAGLSIPFPQLDVRSVKAD